MERLNLRVQSVEKSSSAVLAYRVWRQVKRQAELLTAKEGEEVGDGRHEG